MFLDFFTGKTTERLQMSQKSILRKSYTACIGWLFLLVLLFLNPLFLIGSEDLLKVHLLPKPKAIEWGNAVFPIPSVHYENSAMTSWSMLWLSKAGIIFDSNAEATLSVEYLDSIMGASVNQLEAYSLLVANGNITIKAVTQKGVFNAIQTLHQLIVVRENEQWIQECSITDWPAFPIRGFMHDTSRGFIPIDELKKQIRLLSRFKINVFHWHLTEDIAWRLESKVFPQLTEEENFLRFPGEYYTLAQAREMVAFCQDHNVLLIPEIDMPGHSRAFTRALGPDMQSPVGMRLLKLLLDEICEVFFDLPYIHIGTDEVEFTNPAFVPEMVDYIRAKGKKVISWNPGWEYLSGEIDLLQLWSFRGKLHQGIPAIDSRFHYINHFDTFSDLVGLFNSSIGGFPISNQQMAGAILAVWNDRKLESAREIVNQNNFYPLVLTLAERAWAGGGEHYIADRGVNLLPQNEEELKLFQDFEERLLFFKETTFTHLPFPYVRQTNVLWRITDPFPNEGDLSRVFPPEQELKDSYVFDGAEYSTHMAIGAGIYLRHVWGDLVPAFYQDPEPNHTAYAFSWVYSPLAQPAGLLAGFQNYRRSESDLPPPQGNWDYYQSRIWINDMEILPPLWKNTHSVRSSEIPLRNENWEARPPVPVFLKKGWNKILIKLPIGEFSRPEVRLVKWMFTAVFVSPDGKYALEGIVYDPEKRSFQ